jgi:hypothetical protein
MLGETPSAHTTREWNGRLDYIRTPAGFTSYSPRELRAGAEQLPGALQELAKLFRVEHEER